MNKGDVAWAGGSAGPDFFIAMNRIGGFGSTHTVPAARRTREEEGYGARACRAPTAPLHARALRTPLHAPALGALGGGRLLSCAPRGSRGHLQ